MVFLLGNKTSSGNTKLYKSLGSLIKDYRQWRKLSQETIAESIGVSAREWRNWEINRYRARIENLHDLSEVTGIPMQVCVALNADQPVWYSLSKRRFAYSSIEDALFTSPELFKYREQSDDGILTRYDPITTDKHIDAILSCHKDIYGNERPLQRDVIKAANKILPDLNRIIFDCWGHYVGHLVCLPITKGVYEQIKKIRRVEGYLTAERISDIISLHEGVFFNYSIFASNTSVAYLMLVNSVRYYSKIEPKKRYQVAASVAKIEGQEFYNNLHMKVVKDYANEHIEVSPKLYEIELDVLMKPLGPFGALGWMIEKYDRKTGAENLLGKSKREGCPTNSAHKLHKASRSGGPLIVGGPIIVAKVRDEACLNPKCTLYGELGNGNIIFNGTYRTKEGTQTRRFLCKECGKSFCTRGRSIFYDLRSPEETILMALKFLAQGMSLRGVAKVLGVKRDTVRHWLKVASEQSEKIDAMLMKEPDVSQVELEALWTSVKRNALRQRATLWGKATGLESRLKDH